MLSNLLEKLIQQVLLSALLFFLGLTPAFHGAFPYFFFWCSFLDVEFFCFFPGERTFGVLTKLDLMDKGTNAQDVNFLAFLCSTAIL
jgi:hypothetical protein